MQNKSIKFELQHLRAAETGHKMNIFHFSCEKKLHEKPTLLYFSFAENWKTGKRETMKTDTSKSAPM